MLSSLKTRWLVITIILDVALTSLALLLARWARGYFPGDFYLDETLTFALLDKPLFFPFGGLVLVVITIWLLVFTALSIYDEKFIATQYGRLQPIFIAITGAVFVFAGVAYFIFPNLSRFLFLYFYIFDLLFLCGWRKLALFLFQRYDISNGWQPHHRILIVGQGQRAQDVAHAIRTFAWSGLELVGFTGDKADALAPIQETAHIVRQQNINEVIFALPAGHQTILQELVLQLQPLSINLRVVPDVVDLLFVRATIEDFAGLPLIGLHQPAISVFDRLIKRSFDIVVSLSLLLLSLPITLPIILAIKLSSPGDLFYHSQRIGERGKIFNMYKFRTMIMGADERERDLLVQQDGGIGFNKRPDDPRVTRIGRFLRRTSLDELPQLLNVLTGDMSLVGPRPELPWLVEQYQPWQYQRFTVPQGMTGWWQVKNRGRQHEYQVRVEDDLYYIHNYSFLLDLRIMWLTIGAIIRGDGAY